MKPVALIVGAVPWIATLRAASVVPPNDTSAVVIGALGLNPVPVMFMTSATLPDVALSVIEAVVTVNGLVAVFIPSEIVTV